MTDRIVALGLLTQRDLEVLGSGFKRAFPVNETPCFDDLLRAIDEADRELRRNRESSALPAREASPQDPTGGMA